MNTNKCKVYYFITKALSNLKNENPKIKNLNNNKGEFKLCKLNLKQIKENIYRRQKYLNFHATVEQIPEKINESGRLFIM